MSDDHRAKRLEEHRLYDTALERICILLNKATGLDDDEEFNIDTVREFMVIAWMGGVAWRDEHRDLDLGDGP